MRTKSIEDTLCREAAREPQCIGHALGPQLEHLLPGHGGQPVPRVVVAGFVHGRISLEEQRTGIRSGLHPQAAEGYNPGTAR